MLQMSQDMSVTQASDISEIAMPRQSATPLPPPGSGLNLKRIAIGRGTQNYTCDPMNTTAVPAAVGAKATLFDATRFAVACPQLLDSLSGVALGFLRADEIPTSPAVLGLHIFLDRETPFFALETPFTHLGKVLCAGDSSTPAPKDAPKGFNGEPAVAWLKLRAKNGTTGNIREVYRLQTAGGSALETRKGMSATFERQYAAQYWFYGL
ncbi:hypothetical protein SAPIO_CDS4607 [Scedosporium apiospermum]|uniref:Uncharacterized protein n=1 Tax=Pseudallescheria apiosperma TaxID=563466 RepID=A0A084G7W7_PSEDA|nr:uncharacterized protein SAPIO_CDS4607 [Scedosporium apiospermum]KEZ43429.1 hypothetical protein SAPIO_CDS4607 [Scedosporium apiospermum]